MIILVQLDLLFDGSIKRLLGNRITLRELNVRNQASKANEFLGAAWALEILLVGVQLLVVRGLYF